MPFLPTTRAELKARGISELDFVIVGADAYVDHPSFGAALVGRVLEAAGYAVGVVARPDPGDVEAFRALGRPRLAYLVTAGALDSMVSKYTANKKPRSKDEYAPGGDPRLCRGADGGLRPYRVNGKDANARPDRAVIAYAAKCREAYGGVPVIAGGLEASLRRLSHYDYLSDTIRKPIVLDAKLDLVLYGMAERSMLEAAARLKAWRAETGPAASAAAAGAAAAKALRGIRGSVWRTSKEAELPAGALRLPPHEEAARDKEAFGRSFATQYREADPGTGRPLAEEAAGQWAVQEPPQQPATRAELDAAYGLPFMRAWHPSYDAAGGVPAFDEVKFSLSSSRGCYGACAFCALAFHQGRIVTSRSADSIAAEAELLARRRDFKGYIHDVGGPTANFRGPACRKQAGGSACTDRRCLAPEPCPALEPGHGEYLALLRRLRRLPGVKKVFVRSGLRFDYIMGAPDGAEFLRELAAHHVSGQLKVAPEHASEPVLALMGKPPLRVYERFAAAWATENGRLGLQQYLVPYFIASHPGATLADAIELAEYLRDSGFVPDQAQDFYPTPGTLATAMYHCGFDPLSGRPVYVAKGAKERSMQRALLQFDKPENRALVKEALRLAGRGDLIGPGPRCLVR